MIKKYWFIIGLLLVVFLTLIDFTRTLSFAGQWLKANHGPNAAIILIFFFSGILLQTSQIKAGLKDLPGTLVALFIIFVSAPLLAVLFNMSALSTGTAVGLFLVSVMPTTLSSGVVMTGSAGGNMAHALVITIISNTLAIFTIPVSLSLMLSVTLGNTAIEIDRAAIMIKLALFVVLPLCAGMLTRSLVRGFLKHHAFRLNTFNQILILIVVWMAVSQARGVIVQKGAAAGHIVFLVLLFHAALLGIAGVLVWLLKIGKGRRESVIFMGGQKTLPLSIILQVSLFPQYGEALVVCVLHHIVHLLMDGYLVGWLKKN